MPKTEQVAVDASTAPAVEPLVEPASNRAHTAGAPPVEPAAADDVAGLLDQIGNGPGVQLRVSRHNGEDWEYVGTLADVTEWDEEAFRLRFGPGRYKIEARRGGRFVAGSTRYVRIGQQLGQHERTDLAAPRVPHSPAPPGAMTAEAMLSTALQMMLAAQQQQNQFAQALMVKLLDNKPKPTEVETLESVLQLADRLAALKGGDETSGIGQAVDAFARVLSALPAVAPTPPAREPQRVLIRKRPGGGTSPAIPTPPTTAGPGADAAAAKPAAEAPGPAPQGGELADAGEASAAAATQDPIVIAAGTLLVRAAREPDPDAPAVAYAMMLLLGRDAIAGKLAQVPEGQLAPVMMAAIPELAGCGEFLADLESALRDELDAGEGEEDEPAGGDAGQADADKPES